MDYDDLIFGKLQLLWFFHVISWIFQEYLWTGLRAILQEKFFLFGEALDFLQIFLASARVRGCWERQMVGGLKAPRTLAEDAQLRAGGCLM